jgi:hypothetical protein
MAIHAAAGNGTDTMVIFAAGKLKELFRNLIWDKPEIASDRSKAPSATPNAWANVFPVPESSIPDGQEKNKSKS